MNITPDNKKGDSFNEVDVICDVRDFEGNIDSSNDLFPLWQEISPTLVGESAEIGRQITVNLSQGQVLLTILQNSGVSVFRDDTLVNVRDLLRSPTIRYPCRIHRESGENVYGPYRCVECARLKQPERICEIHAHRLKNAQRAYCPDHLPSCSCGNTHCRATATFICERCKQQFGDHFERHYPNDDTRLLCDRCYRFLFERCSHSGCNRPGRSKCAWFENGKLCDNPLCSRHSSQLKIWLAHNRGITLCDYHARNLVNAQPDNIIMMMLLADPPSRRVRHLLWNPYRLRRIINKKRNRKLSFGDIYNALLSTRRLVQNITPEWLGDDESKRHERKVEWIGQNYEKMVEEMVNVVHEVPRLESNFLRSIQEFYSYNNPRVLDYILNLEIVDLYRRPNRDPEYVVEVSVVPNTKGLFIGRGGAYIKEIQNRLNVRINLEE